MATSTVSRVLDLAAPWLLLLVISLVGCAAWANARYMIPTDPRHAVGAQARVLPFDLNFKPQEQWRLVWQGVDVDGDGQPDFVNPTGEPVRGVDDYGSGSFGASRDGGERHHEGVDYTDLVGQPIKAPISGYVAKIGYAYPDSEALKYVEIVNPALHYLARVFYVDPQVAEGQPVRLGQVIGAAHSLQDRYPRHHQPRAPGDRPPRRPQDRRRQRDHREDGAAPVPRPHRTGRRRRGGVGLSPTPSPSASCRGSLLPLRRTLKSKLGASGERDPRHEAEGDGGDGENGPDAAEGSRTGVRAFPSRREGGAAMIRQVGLPGGGQVPALGQGTWRLGERPSARAEEAAAIREGVALGMTLIDTAEMYGDGSTESFLGEALAGLREQVFLVSKAYPQNASLSRLPRACEASLRRLNTDRIDLYLLHWRGSVPLAETVEAMQALQRDGKILRWGVSNLDLDDMEELVEAGGEGCATNQVLYNLSRRGPEFDLLPWMEERRMPAMAYSPVEQGHLAHAAALRAIAERRGVQPLQVALAWTLRRPDVISIPKASSVEHVRQNREALDLVLTDEELAALDRAFPPPRRKVPLEML
ncbi:MAG: aldo/keto reductase [Caulobacteraceae bacterium]